MSSPVRTWFSLSWPVICRNTSGSIESMLMLMWLRPEARQSEMCRARFQPLVVTATLATPGEAATVLMMSLKSLRTVGSPPVRRTLLRPRSEKPATRRRISSTVRTDSGPLFFQPFGRQ